MLGPRRNVLPGIVLQVLGEPSDQQSFAEADLLAAVAKNEPGNWLPAGGWTPTGRQRCGGQHPHPPAAGPRLRRRPSSTTGNAARLMQQLDWHGTQVLDLAADQPCLPLAQGRADGGGHRYR